MTNFFIKTKFAFAILLLSMIFFASSCSKKNQVQLSMEELYNIAVENCNAPVNSKDINKLVTIKGKNIDKMVTWNNDGDKVLMVTWHHFPDSYKAGENVELKWGEGWTFTDKEVKAWYKKNGANLNDKNFTLRFEQLLGIALNKGHTHFTAYWCNPKDVLRPALNPDITKQISLSDLDGSTLESFDGGNFKEWFYSQKDWATGKTPWTGMGYSYDWSSPHKKTYGLSEFIVKKHSTVIVEWTKSNQEFLEWLSE